MNHVLCILKKKTYSYLDETRCGHNVGSVFFDKN